MRFGLQSQQYLSVDCAHPMKKSELKPGIAPAPPGEGEFSLIPHKKLLDMYAAMLKCRMIANGIGKVDAARLNRSTLISEAVTVGVTIDLEATDAISPLPFDLTPCALRGAALKTLLRWWANPTASFPKVIARAKVISPAASIAARFEVALRLAAHFRSTSSGSVVVFFIGPDTPRPRPAASPMLSRESLESSLLLAAAGRLPILFVSDSRAGADDLLPLSEQCGVPGMVVDRDDVVAVYRSTSEALAHARRGNGPTLIVSRPWRLNGQRRGPRGSIGKMELYLAGKGLASRPVKDRITREFAAELARASNAIVRPGKK